MLPRSHPRNVFHNKSSRLQFLDDTKKVKDQAVSWIIENPVTDEGEPLARWTTNYHIYRLISDSGPFSDFTSG